MSAQLLRLEVREALLAAPVSGATIGDLHGVLGYRPSRLAAALAALVGRGEVQCLGAAYRLKFTDETPAAPTESLKERLLSVRMPAADRREVSRLLPRLHEPAAQAEALRLLYRLEAR